MYGSSDIRVWLMVVVIVADSGGVSVCGLCEEYMWGWGCGVGGQEGYVFCCYNLHYAFLVLFCPVPLFIMMNYLNVFDVVLIFSMPVYLYQFKCF